MRAIVIEKFGDPGVLEMREVERPKPGPGELLVWVIAASVNPVDAKIRATGSWAKRALPTVLGSDASGVVEELGPGAKGFEVGDEVYFAAELTGDVHGTYAEYTTVPAAIVARKPRKLTHLDAAAVPLAGGTAWEAVVRRLRLQVGQTILIHGGAGGVGSFAVQIAAACGAKVIATASAGNLETLRDLGAHVAVDYHKEDPTEVALRETGGVGVDAVLDLVGGDLTPKSCPAVRPFGRMAFILGPKGDLSEAYRRNLELHGVRLMREGRRLEELSAAIDIGKLRPLVEEVMPLDRVADAHRRLDSGHGRGKIVLEVAAR
ncbi:zinc-binding dehydrogenase [Vulgatibacter incomptus]|uniref:Bifunctional protein: zinc-containing alcohol dehydrogenase n=1 Tax=Vulgatibacter incomptus TaxID=1391653 RepID=A0A0K1PHI9_9BACT|nr:zinc-binding dehydrogenase [Vulgatibacter incomptus]AKU92977.1 Bifunctional protein: zinc-containing alcohol dehydrogenase [Vulgatibacter incomptus]